MAWNSLLSKEGSRGALKKSLLSKGLSKGSFKGFSKRGKAFKRLIGPFSSQNKCHKIEINRYFSFLGLVWLLNSFISLL